MAIAAGGIASIVLSGPEGPEIRADVIYVNNRRCALSGRVIPPEYRGRYQQRVRYDGPIDRYRGKTLVFDLGGYECARVFPAHWDEESAAIMREHGLLHWRWE